MKGFDYEQLSPNIRRVVRQLHEWGYETTDSGDGSQHADRMECAVPFPMVAISMKSGDHIVAAANLLWTRLVEHGVTMGFSFGDHPSDVRRVEVMYSTADNIPGLLLIGVTNSNLPKENK